MIGKWTFAKPELTYLHLKNICSALEAQAFSIQMMPVLKLLEVFARHVLESPVLERAHQL